LIFRRVRGILNKLTPEKFDKLSRNLTNIGIDCKTILKGIIILIFEKAIDEPKYCEIYARLCQKLSQDAPNFDEPDSKSNTFLRLLLSKCQDEFETRSKASSVFDRKDEPLTEMEKHAKNMAKRKMLGNLKFIGELGKFELLQEAILHKCIQQLLAKKKRTSLCDMAEDIECLCQIVQTVGKRLDTPRAKNIMDQYFDRMDTLSKSEELPSRIRFMLQDVIDLRAMGWQPRRFQADNGPRSVTQMRWEMYGPSMMTPPYSYFPPGMSPPSGMPGATLPPMAGGGGSGSPLMGPWFSDPSFTGGISGSGDTALHNPADDHTDIFGRAINHTPKASQPKPQPAVVARPPPQAKPDLFEPHYLKAKNKPQTTNTPINQAPQPRKLGPGGVPDDEKDTPKPKPPINKSNPWNMDPFVPHYNKPAVSMVSINNEQAAKNDKTPSPSLKSSSPQSIRAYNMSATNNKPAAKKTNEISLRPSSFLKKEEKPKTNVFTKTEELPAKLQHFTNLTINDKTKTSNKTSNKLSKNDIDNKIVEVIGGHKGSDDTDSVCGALQSLCTNIKYSKMVAKQLMYFGANSPSDDWNFIGKVFLECIERSILSIETTVNAFTLLLDDLKIMDVESGKEFVAKFAAMFVINDMLTMSKVVDHFQDGSHYPTVLLFLQKLHQEKGKDWLMDSLKSSKFDLVLTFPKDSRSDSQLMAVMQEKELAFVFPHLCLKEELISLMKQGESEENLIQWVKENVEGKIETKLVIRMIVFATVSMATQETLSTDDLSTKPEKEVQELEKDAIARFKTFLKTFVGGESSLQLEVVYVLQMYCNEYQFPKEMLLRLFIIFYNTELVDEDVFLQWKEDINETYPGKGKALFQVNNWLQWLETADEEDEDEMEEEEG